VVLLNSKKNGDWDKVSNYLSKKEKYINNEKVRAITGDPDSFRVSRLLKKWVDQGLLIRIDSGSKRRVKYRLPVDSRW
jgi:hypothetical protein